MIVEIIKPFFKWKPGDQPDVTEEMAAELVGGGVAFVHEDQTRRDYKPKPEGEKKKVVQFYLKEKYHSKFIKEVSPIVKKYSL